MPLLTKVFPSLERLREKSGGRSNEAQYTEAYDDFDEGDMTDDPLLNSSQTNKADPAPALPQKSARRASRALDDLAAKLASLPGQSANELETDKELDGSDPHESYLSSEEEASEIADDYDESIIDLDCYRPPSLDSRHSHEDTARVVSFVYVGKPQLIDIFTHDSSLSPHDDGPPSRRPSPLYLNSTSSQYRPSISSTRSSSLNALGSLTNGLGRLRRVQGSISGHVLTPLFLQSDPFAAEGQEIQTASPIDSPTPKTPTSIANAAWKGSIKGMQRTLTKARRKTSIPRLSLAFAQGAAKPQSPVTARPSTPPMEISTTGQTPQTPKQEGPVYYKDIIRSAIHAPPPALPVSPKLTKARTATNILKMGRRGSLKGGMI